MDSNSPSTIYTTFGIPASADVYTEFATPAALVAAIEAGTLQDKPLFVLGGGSNVIFSKHFAGQVVKMANKGIRLVDEPTAEGCVLVNAAAGECWDGFVRHCIAQGWYGVENMAEIPGTVGAAPVQNVGAYGVEAKDVVEWVHAIDILTGRERRFSNEECGFGYRTSVFKRELKGRYVVVDVTFRLRTVFEPDLRYAGIANALSAAGIAEPTAQQVADTVAAIRWEKLPRPEQKGSAGSFFKNPVVGHEQMESLRRAYPDIVAHAVDGGFKLSAGWLIDRAGWKGRTMGRCGVYEKQALVLVNLGGCTGSEVVALADTIADDIAARFGVTLEREAIIL